MPYERVTSQPENPFSSLIPDQQIAVVPSFTLESGVTIRNVPVAYTTRGRLSPGGDNAMVICHALSGSADVADWWGPLLGGAGRAFDTTRFFLICINSLGSPYGTASPVTYKDGDAAQGRYGPEFPLTTIRDDVRLSKLLLDDLGVRQIAAVVGGSMGGMSVLEYAYLSPDPDYVRAIVPIATSARHSAWCISWGEAQRQSIYCDPKYEDGYYDFSDPPAAGLGAARMSALLTYRSRDSFESRFGRNVPNVARRLDISGKAAPRDAATASPTNEHFNIHNEGHRGAGLPRQSSSTSLSRLSAAGGGGGGGDAPPDVGDTISIRDPEVHGATPIPTAVVAAGKGGRRATTFFSAQSYLRYQGDKFIKRFDANCYIAITRKLDTHDVSAHCADAGGGSGEEDPLAAALGMIHQPTLVLGIKTDGLFTFAEQEQIARGIPGARLETIESQEGHDAFLLQFEQVNKYILDFFAQTLPDVLAREPVGAAAGPGAGEGAPGKVTKDSTFGEAEVEDITAW